MALHSFAPAKINLSLHVGPPRADGMHPLHSLIAFADVGDVVVAEAADALTLSVRGPFAAALTESTDNLVLRAAQLLARHAGAAPRAALTLHKHLPIASGIGGGSADAAAALRVLNELWACGASETDLEALASSLGADVPGCIRSSPAWMGDTGGALSPASVPPLDAVLVNPGAPAPTGAVYAAFDRLGAFGALDDPGSPPLQPAAFVAWLAGLRNDLEAAARSVAPAIADVLAVLQACAPGALVRMSGSGATCFAVATDAAAVAARVAAQRPHWWVRPARLGGVDVGVTGDYPPRTGADGGAGR